MKILSSCKRLESKQEKFHGYYCNSFIDFQAVLLKSQVKSQAKKSTISRLYLLFFNHINAELDIFPDYFEIS